MITPKNSYGLLQSLSRGKQNFIPLDLLWLPYTRLVLVCEKSKAFWAKLMLCYSFCASLHHPELGQGLNMNTAISLTQVSWFIRRILLKPHLNWQILSKIARWKSKRARPKRLKGQNFVKKFLTIVDLHWLKICLLSPGCTSTYVGCVCFSKNGGSSGNVKWNHFAP